MSTRVRPGRGLVLMIFICRTEMNWNEEKTREGEREGERERERGRERRELERRRERRREKEKERQRKEKKKRMRERENPPLPACTFRTPPCVRSKRLSVFLQNARMLNTSGRRVKKAMGTASNETTEKEEMWKSVGSGGMADQSKTQGGEHVSTGQAELTECEGGKSGGWGGPERRREKSVDRTRCQTGTKCEGVKHKTVEEMVVTGNEKKPQEMDVGRVEAGESGRRGKSWRMSWGDNGRKWR